MKPTFALLLSLTILTHALSDIHPAPLPDTGGVTGGLIVRLGCADPDEVAALRLNDGCLVFALDTDPARIKALREKTTAVQADLFDGARLPLIDNLVTLLVVAESFRVSQEEMMRVLAPGGVLLTKAGTGWKKTVKPRPANIDEWAHYLRSPDNNAVSTDTKDSSFSFPTRTARKRRACRWAPFPSSTA